MLFVLAAVKVTSNCFESESVMCRTVSACSIFLKRYYIINYVGRL